MMSYSVIIPAYNEDGAIKEVLEKMAEKLDAFGQPYEILVVNDGSTDKTREAVLAAGCNVILVEHEFNMGYGAALKTGIKKAKYEYIVITDADGTYPNEMIPQLVMLAVEGEHDMVVGARTGVDVNIPMIRKPAKWFISWLANYLTGMKIPDLNSGLRVIRKAVVESRKKILPSGFSFTSTITIAMLTNGYSVKYVPINYFKRTGKSKIKPIQDTMNFVQLIIRTTLYFRPLKVFMPLCFLLFMLAILVLIGSWLCLEKVMDVTFGVVMMTAVMVMAIGMLADLIDKRT